MLTEFRNHGYAENSIPHWNSVLQGVLLNVYNQLLQIKFTVLRGKLLSDVFNINFKGFIYRSWKQNCF